MLFGSRSASDPVICLPAPARLRQRAWKRSLIVVLLALTLGAVSQAALARYAALVIDADTGEVLFSRHADERRLCAQSRGCHAGNGFKEGIRKF